MNTIFVKPSDPILTKRAEEIPQDQIDSKETEEIIKTMLKVAYGQQKGKNKPILVGLAAPQIGISKRIILVDTKANGKGKVGDLKVSFSKKNSLLGNLKVYINPKITWSSKEKEEWYEGCYSTGNVCGIVSRSASIKIQGYSVKVTPWLRSNLNMVKEKWTGYTARIFQHEIDHLNGKVFVDLIKDSDKLHWVLKNDFAIYRNKEAWRNWPKKYSLKKWEKTKKGTS